MVPDSALSVLTCCCWCWCWRLPRQYFGQLLAGSSQFSEFSRCTDLTGLTSFMQIQSWPECWSWGWPGMPVIGPSQHLSPRSQSWELKTNSDQARSDFRVETTPDDISGWLIISITIIDSAVKLVVAVWRVAAALPSLIGYLPSWRGGGV